MCIFIACHLKVLFLLVDLQELFRVTNKGTDGKLTYKDLQNLVGVTLHELQSFKEFDADGDEKYSLPELRAALGV